MFLAHTQQSIEHENGTDHNIGHGEGTETLAIYVPCISYLLVTGHRYMSLFLIDIKIKSISAGVTHIHRYLGIHFGE
jgi:hypothetical protein